MAFLIQGLFFQEQIWLSLGYDIQIGERVMVNEQLIQFMYAGAIWTESDEPSAKWTGLTQDHFGTAKLSEIEIHDDGFKFIKKYNHRKDFIQYSFKRDGKFWVGEWGGPLVGSGITRCTLTEVPEKFFLPEKIEEQIDEHDLAKV